MCCDSPSPPAAPDTSLYQAGMVDAANKDLAFRQQVYNDSKPRQEALYNMAMRVANDQLGDAATARERGNVAWGDWNELGRPLQRQVVGEAQAYGGAADQAMQSGRAIADVNSQAANARAQNARAMASMGVNPNSGRFAAMSNAQGLSQAAMAAGAATNARTQARDKGIALRASALGQLGGQQSVAGQNLGLGVNAGSAGMGNANTGFMSGLPYAQYASGGYTGLMNANQGAGQMGLQAYDSQMKGYLGQQQANGQAAAGLGQLAGQAATLYMLSS